MEPFAVARYRDKVKEKLGLTPPQMLREVYEATARKDFAKREAFRRSIRTKPQWHAESMALRQRFIQALGGPIPQGHPEIRVCRSVKRSALEFRSLLVSLFKDHWISATLVLPPSTRTLPAIILAHGHGTAGRFGYLPLAAYFAANGYAVLAFDLFGGGERYLPAPDGTCFAPNSGQHNLPGSQMGLLGFNLAWLMLTDSVAMVDTLHRLREVDATRIGMTGSSGGGWCSFFTPAVDSRITAAAPAASVHSFKGRLHPDDAEQSVFDAITPGLDYPDVASFLIAPRPLFIVAKSHDIWGIDSTRYVADEARRFYRLHAEEERLSIRVWEAGHACGSDHLKAILKWFNRWLNNSTPGVSLQRATRSKLPSPSQLRVSESGNLYSDGFPSPLEALLSRTGCGRVPIKKARSWLKRAVGPAPRRVSWEEIDAHPAGSAEGRRIIFESEKRLRLPAEMLMPRKPKGVMILLDELDRREARDWQAQAAAAGYAAIRPDLRGCGEAALDETWEDWENVVQTLFNGKRQRLSALAHLIGRHVNLDRTRDARALVSVARRMGLKGPVVLWGRRVGALVATLTAVTDRRVSKVILEDCLRSFEDVLKRDLHTLSPDEFVFGLLRDGADLPALRASSGELRSVIRRPLDPFQQPQH